MTHFSYLEDEICVVHKKRTFLPYFLIFSSITVSQMGILHRFIQEDLFSSHCTVKDVKLVFLKYVGFFVFRTTNGTWKLPSAL